MFKNLLKLLDLLARITLNYQNLNRIYSLKEKPQKLSLNTRTIEFIFIYIIHFFSSSLSGAKAD